MPSLPSSPPSAPSFPPSPVVGLAIFVGVFVVVTGIYAFHGVASRWMAARRARTSDIESVGDSSAAPIEAKAKPRNGSSPVPPAEVLFAARTAVFVLKAKTAAEKERVSIHKVLMARSAPLKKAKPVEGSSVLGRFSTTHSEVSIAGHVGARRKRSLPGPSPLRLVFTAPRPPPSCSPESVPTTTAVPITSLVPVAVLPPASPATAKGTAALILSALARGDDDWDSDSDYNDDEDDADAPSIIFDAILGIWTNTSTSQSPASSASHVDISIRPAPPSTRQFLLTAACVLSGSTGRRRSRSGIRSSGARGGSHGQRRRMPGQNDRSSAPPRKYGFLSSFSSFTFYFYA
ncbi:hypothetical protein B0H12DRAFT_424017 [Mycena haematopus]|nr:hypothetical protein B0H12DRAFT_424017 [Mycena haematopus]